MAADRELQTFTTPGGHLRVRAESLEEMRDGNHKRSTRPAPPSSVLTNRREKVEELGLEAQELRAKREISKLKAEEQAEERRQQEALEASERHAEIEAEAEAQEQERWRQEQAEKRERREQERQLAQFHSGWLKKAAEVLADKNFSWLAGPQRKEVLKEVEEEIRDRQPEEEPCMLEIVTQTIVDVTAPWYAGSQWQARLKEAMGRAIRGLPYGVTDTERTRAIAAVRKALEGVAKNAEEFEIRAAIAEAVEPVRQAVEKRNLTERVTTWAVWQLPWSRTDSDERCIRRECAEILAELPDGVSEEDAKEALEETIQEAKEEIEDRKARKERKRKKASLIQYGLSEITSYLLRLRQEKVISSEEYWDSELREELTGTVRNALKEEISGEESNKEVKKLVHDIVDEELEIVEEEDEELE
ncbi:MAG: hypothetical protein A3F68_10405 [Acidobacteria bacterium RIFCSPLOWO2_12_FULL_54_10]|nr:MAG: hypothetical protein A3F68_10405 [Acidobacteria bacterium RIFCSPLOWO2_12_FULL_54_10]